MAFFPLFVNLKDKEVLIVGTGGTAFRSAKTLIPYGASIIVAGEQLGGPFRQLMEANGERCTFLEAPLSKESIGELLSDPSLLPTLVVAASDNAALNKAVYDYYTARHVLVADVSNRSQCDFLFPTVIRRGDVVCGISSSGKSPHVSEFLRNLIESIFPEAISDINDHMDEIYQALKQATTTPEKRNETMARIFSRLIEDENQTPDYEIDAMIGEAEL